MHSLGPQWLPWAWLSLMTIMTGCGGLQHVDPPEVDGPEVDGPMHHEVTHHEGKHSHQTHEGPIGHSFEDVDRYAARWNDPARDDWQKPDEVIAIMGIEPGMTVADIGPGTGYLEPYLATAVGTEGRVLALDAEPNMIAYLEKRAKNEDWTNVEARLVEFSDPKVTQGEVARVVVVNTWHHIRDREIYGAKVFAGLQPGGSITVVEYTMEVDDGPPMEIRLKPEQVVAELKAAGFEAEVIEESLPRQYVVIGRKAKD